LQPAPEEDFTVEAKFDSPLTLRFQQQGIVVEESPTDFLRFELYYDGSKVRVFAAAVRGSSATTYANLAVSGQPAFLRVGRVGNEWIEWHSFDGVDFIESARFTSTAPPTRVGVYAGN